jgi:cholesterol transport system auxiliary component
MSSHVAIREARRDHDNCASNPSRNDGKGVSPDAFRGSGESRETLLRIVRIALALCLAMALPACSLLGKAEPIQIIDPTPAQLSDASLPSATWSLIVLRPDAAQSLDTERIVVRPTPGALQVYKGAAWPDTAPDLVQASLLRAFEDSGRILSVARPGGAVRGDFQLASELRKFESVYVGAAPQAVVELHVRLIRVTDGTAVAAKTFRVSETAAGTDVRAIGEAFAKALATLDHDTVAWALTEGNRTGK